MANRLNFFRAPLLKRLIWLLLFGLTLWLLLDTPLGNNWGISAVLLLVLLILNVLLAFKLFRTGPRVEPERPRMIFPEEQPAIVRELMDVCIATEEGDTQTFRGPLRESTAVVYEKLKASLSGQTVLLQEDEKLEAAILLKPGQFALFEEPASKRTNWLLFFATFLTTTWVGASYRNIDLLHEPTRFFAGLPYSIGILAILGCHELGHYFAARRHNMNVTPPYFIPIPFGLGTFGAFIKMKAPPENRTSLFDMAVAGPLAGLVIAIPALLIGFPSSVLIQLKNAPPNLELVDGGPFTDSILFNVLARISLGHPLDPGTIIHLGPLAFAGSIGLLITALNLLPVGQLDGGHIARSILGTRAGERVGRAVMLAFFLYALWVPAFLIWAVLVFLLAGNVTPPANDLVPISRGRRWLGYFSFVVLAVLIPLPEAIWHNFSIFKAGF